MQASRPNSRIKRPLPKSQPSRKANRCSRTVAGAIIDYIAGQVDFPESDAVVNHNPIAVLAGATQPELAQEFVDLVTGPQGQQVLDDAGFGKP